MEESLYTQSLEQIVAKVRSTESGISIGLSIKCVQAILDAGERGEKYHDVMRGEYEKVSVHIRSQTKVQNIVASIACRGAMLLEKVDDVIEFAWIFIQAGDIERFFSVLEFLTSRKMGDRARGLFQGFFHVRDQYSHIGLQELRRLAQYAYVCGCDEIGYELACRAEGEKIGEEDPKILKYRQVVRTPEEFDIAISEMIHYFRGKSAYISKNLSDSLREYIETQIDHLTQKDAIEPEMLKHYEAKLEGDTDGYNFRDTEGKNYVCLSFYTILAVLFQDANRASFLLKSLIDDRNFEDTAHIIGDVVYDLQLGDFEEDAEEKSLENDIKDGLLTPLMKMYAGIEYADDIHAQMYQLLERMYGITVRDWINSFRTRSLAAGARFTEIAGFYLGIINTVHKESSPMVSMQLQMQALQNENGGPCLVSSYSELALYAMWFFLYHGKFPIIASEIVQHLSIMPNSDICVGFLKQIYVDNQLDAHGY